jgi:hypothetical protein
MTYCIFLKNMSMRTLYLSHPHTLGSHLDLGRNMEPSMKTEPDSRMYQQEESSPVLQASRNH